jgi:hypothetical protein
MTDKEKNAAKTFERVLAEMTPAEKEKALIFIEGMAFRASVQGTQQSTEAS